MKFGTVLILLSLFTMNGFTQTTRTITGKIIDERLDIPYQARIYSEDTTLLGTADINGNFKIAIKPETKFLLVGCLNMEWKHIDLIDSCTNFEIILMNSVLYHFMSARKVDRLRRKRFDKLPELYRSAYEKGIFKMEKQCYQNKFVPIKDRLKQISNDRS